MELFCVLQRVVNAQVEQLRLALWQAEADKNAAQTELRREREQEREHNSRDTSIAGGGVDRGE